MSEWQLTITGVFDEDSEHGSVAIEASGEIDEDAIAASMVTMMMMDFGMSKDDIDNIYDSIADEDTTYELH